MTGTIISLRREKGYGFLRGTDNLSRFFHASDVRPLEAFDFMHDGQPVEFIPVGSLGAPASQKGNGYRATDVRPVNTFVTAEGGVVVHE